MEWEVKKIGLKIKKLRKQFNKTSTELAKEVQISQPYLSQIENGHQAVPLDVLIKICGVFGITLSEFFSDKLVINTQFQKLLLSAEKLNEEQIEALQKFLDTIQK